MQYALPAARARHYLVIGPWNHAGTSTPRTEFGGLKVGPESRLDLHELHLEWYRWTLQNGPRPAFLRQRVAYYVTGAETWRYADTLEDVTACYERYFLDSTTNANDVFSSGSLGPLPGSGAPDFYTYDPGNTSGPEVEVEAQVPGDSLVDQRLVFALRGRMLVYHTAPFQNDTEISGFFRLQAWLSIDCPDTDFYVSVHEISSRGSSVRLSADTLRARYRDGLRTPKLIRTSEPLLYEFGRFTFVARRVRRAHRLRLVIAPFGRFIEAPFTQKNYNGGGVVAEESIRDARPVTVRLFHDADHPSSLYIPLGPTGVNSADSI
jgi:putative CocE/NonD family hydrolase